MVLPMINMLYHDTYPSGKVHGLLRTMGHHATHHDEVMVAEWLESMRKDIECTFGILKQRFRILKNYISRTTLMM